MASQKCYEEHQNDEVVVVMVPFPMQGHLNQILHLSFLISSYQIPLHFAGSTTHNHQVKIRLNQNPKSTNLSKIQFHDFQIPPFISIPPNPNNPIKFPSHLQPLFHACAHLQNPVSKLLLELSRTFKRVIVIHDTLVSSVVQDVRSMSNVESFALQSVSAFTVFLHMWDSIEEERKPFRVGQDIIPSSVPSSEGCFTQEFANFIAKEYKVLDFESGRIFNTCSFLEGRYIDLLAKLAVNEDKKLFAIGPFNAVEKNTECRNVHKCLEWLDRQETSSVLYISFGTTTSLRDDQIKELANGLDKSGQNFIWVLRNADKDDIFTPETDCKSPILPKGYEERVKNRGIVVTDWVPQVEILGHRSTGGFMSHCGWNSCIESISMGVPIIAWPMHSDQPRNSVLVTQVLKIGIEVRNWGKRDDLVKEENVRNVVERLMESKEGKEIRKRAQKLGEGVRREVAKGGASSLEMDSFIAYITR